MPVSGTGPMFGGMLPVTESDGDIDSVHQESDI